VSQLTILYNSEILPKSVGCKIVDLRSRLRFLISGHSEMLVKRSIQEAGSAGKQGHDKRGEK